ncbi:MAG: hypothetical protein ACXVBW_12515, partial [Bdellovibrionota bacterium]
MKASGKRILAVIAALNLYGLLSALFNAWTTGLTVDESTFQLAGREFLAHRDPTVLIDHPPMAMWLGALYPWFSGDFSAFAYRIGHVVLFFSAGVYISTRLWKSAGVWAALVFSVIYNLDPFMKAMASLHVTDGDVLAWVGMAGVSVWSSRQRSNETPVRSLLLGGFFYGLAIVT